MWESKSYSWSGWGPVCLSTKSNESKGWHLFHPPIDLLRYFILPDFDCVNSSYSSLRSCWCVLGLSLRSCFGIGSVLWVFLVEMWVGFGGRNNQMNREYFLAMKRRFWYLRTCKTQIKHKVSEANLIQLRLMLFTEK